MSKISGCSLNSMGNRDFLSRITKTLYYGKLPKTHRLSLPISELASELFSEAQQGYSLNRLYCEDVSTISRNACVSPCSFVLALLYLERLKTCNSDYLQHVAPSKLFLISLMISSKFLQDDGEEDEVFTDEWAKSGDITVSELCKLEKEFLYAIDWNVFVRESIFWNRLEKLESDIALREGRKRGWFTYTELKYLSTAYEITHLLQTLVAVSTVFAITYVIGVATLAGSVFISSQIPGTYLHQTEKTLQTEIKFQTNNNVTYADILLANTDFSNCDKTEFPDVTSWDWWNNPIMTWLSDISTENNEFQSITLPRNYYKNLRYDKFIINNLQLENKIELNVGLQERSWHEEWTDSVFNTLHEISAY